MACMIIRDGRRQDAVFALRRDAVAVGRHPSNELVLPNVSVSRLHARFRKELEGWFVEDAGSQNGVKVNGRRVQRQMLVQGDRVELGRYELVFIADELADPVYDGKLVEALPRWHGGGRADEARTFRFDPGDLERLREKQHRVQQAVLVTERGDVALDRDVLVLGPGHDIPVRLPGRAGVRVAELRRKGRGWQLVKLDRWAVVQVNGVAVLRRDLRPGDKLLVGGSELVYSAG